MIATKAQNNDSHGGISMLHRQRKQHKRIWYTHRGTVIVFIALRILIVLTGVLSFLREDYESVFISIFTFFLLFLPSILSQLAFMTR